MIIVTGGAGFIGSNLVKGLNDQGYDNILIVDNLTNAEKCKNMVGLKFKDYVDKMDFANAVQNGKYGREPIEAVFHQGACSDTMEYNGKYMMANNYEYSKMLFDLCIGRKIQYIYASSASTYGGGKKGFTEGPASEDALNVYAFSKLAFDRYVQRHLPLLSSQVVGLKYFNVYGPQENHKGRMASIAYQLYRQLQESGVMKLFGATDGYGAGEQKRDFVYVKDVVKVNLFFWEHPEISGIFNCGTGTANSFNAVARALQKVAGKGEIEYVPFPDVLKGKYQSFTQADTDKLLAAGYQGGFMPLEEAVADYYRYLENSDGYIR
ncbi:adp-l-glycero-d-manno-heptose-6-epimerase [Lucifera butyrica]|uniref:ADP-L-glycero-D-manno-heptose-6-epimerase n=1 Tax=Lucifera butyrica TaxID=1351585 RepID=A0A498RCY1_9FIRM|nr:ADP-glyceromanno-heptose 6-epimerase [Lucifera butyrica]VBB09301.1 adp-l-glycero-d-manno-heptose-6-epimerase [Lucifera butyrica]